MFNKNRIASQMGRLFFSCFLILIITSGDINAQIVTDRPDQTESSSTVGFGDLQIESGILVGYVGSETASVRQILLPTNLLRYGLTKGVELRLLSQFETQKTGDVTVQGISDIEIGTKIQILKNENKNTEIALLSHLVAPTGTTELTSSKFGTVNKLCISHAIGNNLGIGYNLGYNYFGENNGDFTYSIALAAGVNEKVGVYIEPYGEVVDFNEFVLNFDAGFTYLANDNLQFDFSFGTGVNEKMNYISVGFSWLLEKA